MENTDSAESHTESLKDSSDSVEYGDKMDLQVWASCYATHATKILADFLAMTRL